MVTNRALRGPRRIAVIGAEGWRPVGPLRPWVVQPCETDMRGSGTFHSIMVCSRCHVIGQIRIDQIWNTHNHMQL